MPIREAASKDATLLAQLISDSFRDVAEKYFLTPENCPTHPSNYTPVRVEADFVKGVRYFVLEDEGKVCGCVAMEVVGPEHCYLERLAVLPEYRRKGFGDTLVQCVVEQARALGLKRIEIAIIAQQTDLQRWYEARGFSVTGEKVFEHLPFKVKFMSTELSGG